MFDSQNKFWNRWNGWAWIGVILVSIASLISVLLACKSQRSAKNPISTTEHVPPQKNGVDPLDYLHEELSHPKTNASLPK